MKKLKNSKLISLLLAAVMLAAVVPIAIFATGSGSGTSDDPCVVSSFADFKAAMENSSIQYVKLTGSGNEDLPENSGYEAAITVAGTKYLTVEGNKTFASNGGYGYDCLLSVMETAYLYVSGTGRLQFSPQMNAASNAVIRQEGGNVSVTGSVTLKSRSVNYPTYGYAINHDFGRLDIAGGNLIGSLGDNTSSGLAAVFVACGDESNVTISGGKFEVELFNGAAQKQPGLLISDVSSINGVKLSGGTYTNGIETKSTSTTYNDYLTENCMTKEETDSEGNITEIKILSDPVGYEGNPEYAYAGTPITAELFGEIANLPESDIWYDWELSSDNGDSWYAAQCLNKSFTPLESDVGQLLKVSAGATGYSGWLESNPIEIKKQSQTLTGTVTTDSDTAYVGKPITAIVSGGNVGSIPESSLHYYWYLLDDMGYFIGDIGSGKTYTPSQSDLDEGGWYIGVFVTADGYDGQLNSNNIPLEPALPTLTGTVTTDSDTAYVGKPITAIVSGGNVGSIPESALHYEWYAEFSDGYTAQVGSGKTYTPSQSDLDEGAFCVYAAVHADGYDGCLYSDSIPLEGEIWLESVNVIINNFVVGNKFSQVTVVPAEPDKYDITNVIFTNKLTDEDCMPDTVLEATEYLICVTFVPKAGYSVTQDTEKQFNGVAGYSPSDYDGYIYMSPAGGGIPGDYDCSGAVNVQDAILTLRAAMGLITPSAQSLLNADMDGSGTLTVTDAITILRMAMGLI